MAADWSYREKAANTRRENEGLNAFTNALAAYETMKTACEEAGAVLQRYGVAIGELTTAGRTDEAAELGVQVVKLREYLAEGVVPYDVAAFVAALGALTDNAPELQGMKVVDAAGLPIAAPV